MITFICLELLRMIGIDMIGNISNKDFILNCFLCFFYVVILEFLNASILDVKRVVKTVKKVEKVEKIQKKSKIIEFE